MADYTNTEEVKESFWNKFINVLKKIGTFLWKVIKKFWFIIIGFISILLLKKRNSTKEEIKETKQAIKEDKKEIKELTKEVEKSENTIEKELSNIDIEEKKESQEKRDEDISKFLPGIRK